MANTVVSRVPRLTAVHVVALLLAGQKTPGRAVLVVHGDGRVALSTAQAFLLGGSGRMMLTDTELAEVGVRLASTGARLAPGSGAVVGALLEQANTYLRQVWGVT
ncbi:hypothetical protein [Nocardia sp. XZ_19_369]|uniref:hypothetical protein n=1 Tax=Nocardia sp. XZ_19_369 TaxID=2769487 RepID=UPI0018909A23|nr:hypothetical protein [Nocardia sp. XZ_19_369]